MAQVRVLRAFRGVPAGVFAEVVGRALKDGLKERALDDQVTAEEVPDAETWDGVIGEEDGAAVEPPPVPNKKPANPGK